MSTLSIPFSRITAEGVMGVRDYILPLVLIALFVYLPPLWAAYAVVFGGQAHFLMAYLYQYRAGKMTRPLYIIAVGALSLVALWYFLTFTGKEVFLPIFLVASNLFGLHYAIDELTLHQGERADLRRMVSILGFITSFAVATVFVALPHLSSLPYVALGVAALAALVRLFLRGALSRAERYLWFVTVLLVGLAVAFPSVLHPYSTIAIIAWLHFFNWMIGYGVRVRGAKEKERRYWMETAATFAVSLGLFALFLWGPVRSLEFLFGFAAYNAWAIAHIVLSFVASRAPRTA